MRATLAIALTLACALGVTDGWAGTDTVEIAWKRAGQADYAVVVTGAAPSAATSSQPLSPTVTTPLGSVWKLFVHVYQSDAERIAPEYVCRGVNVKEEAFCCPAGRRVGADEALVRSCGLYFEPVRLGISPDGWRSYWSAGMPESARWVVDLAKLKPDTTVSVASLLDALDAIAPGRRQRSEYVLLGTVINAPGRLVRALGGGVRVKTWTWDHPSGDGRRIGGVAGWLSDGTVVWARGESAGVQVLERATPALAALSARAAPRAHETECVDVTFFARYPLREVVDARSGRPVVAGALEGDYRVEFQNGNQLMMRGSGELSLVRVNGEPRISGRLGLNEYVARVLDREAAPQPAEAAKALAIAARTYVFQNAGRQHGCHAIADTSATQRVSPNPATGAARRIAAWTDGLIVSNVAVRYHRSEPGRDTMAWNDAVAAAAEGRAFDEILTAAYPHGTLAPMYGDVEGDCDRMPGAERWLKERAPRWRQRLLRELGFESPPAELAICHARHGRPWADALRRRIYLRGLVTSDDRIALAHEYLHLGFRWHPRGLDEAFIERVARELVHE